MSNRNNKLSTAAARKDLAQQLKVIANEHGGTFECTQEDPRKLRIAMTLGSYFMTAWLDGENRSGAILGHWHTEKGATFDPEFATVIHGHVNPHHFGKATTCEETPEKFLASIRDGFAALALKLGLRKEAPEEAAATLTETGRDRLVSLLEKDADLRHFLVRKIVEIDPGAFERLEAEDRAAAPSLH